MLVKTGEVEVSVEILGEDCEGAPVVFLHGVGGDGSNWAPQMHALSARFQVIALDARGHGLSACKGQNLTLEHYAEDVLQVFHALKIERAHVVGLSMGGMVAQALALRAPDRVASLVLADTSARADANMAASLKAAGDAAIAYGMAAVADQFLPACFCPAAINENREYLRRFREGFTSRDPQAFHTALQAIADLDFLDRLDQIAVPTLVIVGSSDVLTPVQNSEAIAARIPGARLVVLEGAAHIANFDQPHEFTNALKDFLEEVA